MDQRIRTLTEEVNQSDLNTLKSLLYFAVDHTTFGTGNARKLLLVTILNSLLVEDNTNDYQAMTPKAFYDSIMTEVRKGIGRLATAQEVTEKTAEGLLNSEAQTLMQTQWKKDFFKSQQRPETWRMDSDTINASRAMQWVNTINYSGSGGVNYPCIPSDGSQFNGFNTVYLTYSIVTNLGQFGAGVFLTRHSVNQTSYTMGTTGVTLILESGGDMFLVFSSGVTLVRFSGNFNATLS